MVVRRLNEKLTPFGLRLWQPRPPKPPHYYPWRPRIPNKRRSEREFPLGRRKGRVSSCPFVGVAGLCLLLVVLLLLVPLYHVHPPCIKPIAVPTGTVSPRGSPRDTTAIALFVLGHAYHLF